MSVTLQIPFAHLKAAAFVARALKTAGNAPGPHAPSRAFLGVHIRATDEHVDIVATDGRLVFRARSPRAEPHAALPAVLAPSLVLDAHALCVDLNGAPKSHGPYVYLSDTEVSSTSTPYVHMSTLRGEWDAPGRHLSRDYPETYRIEQAAKRKRAAQTAVFDPELVALAHEAISIVHQPLGKATSLARTALHCDDVAGKTRGEMVVFADPLGGQPHHTPEMSPVVIVIAGTME